MSESRFSPRGLGPRAKSAILGVIGGIVLCVGVALWIHFVLDVDATTEQDRITIPDDLEGLRFDRARATLQALGLEDVRTPGSAYYLGAATRIEAVIPAPGTEVEKNSTVTLLPK